MAPYVLGDPGRIVAVDVGIEMADVEVAGVVRPIHLELLDGPFVPDDYILIHLGFALERITEEQAREALPVFADGDMTSSAAPAGWAAR